jgi:hypothetical protein
MSTLSPAQARAFHLRDDAEQRRESALAAADLLASASGLLPVHRRELLSIVVWKWTEADGGKYGCRYRSAGVYNCSAPIEVQHEHVVTRELLVDEMIAIPERCRSILANAIACLVTPEEHRRLSSLERSIQGWKRYLAAKVDVWDVGVTPPVHVDLSSLTTAQAN